MHSTMTLNFMTWLYSSGKGHPEAVMLFLLDKTCHAKNINVPDDEGDVWCVYHLYTLSS